mgnify:CR=1 FL=1
MGPQVDPPFQKSDPGEAPKLPDLGFFSVFCLLGPLRPHMAPVRFFWARFGRFFGPFCPSLGSFWLLLAPFGRHVGSILLPF